MGIMSPSPEPPTTPDTPTVPDQDTVATDAVSTDDLGPIPERIGPSRLHGVLGEGGPASRLLADAEALYREALEGDRRWIGPAERDTLVITGWLATALHRSGSIPEAVELLSRPYREVLAARDVAAAARPADRPATMLRESGDAAAADRWATLADQPTPG